MIEVREMEGRGRYGMREREKKEEKYESIERKRQTSIDVLVLTSLFVEIT